ncbi:GAF domain-containing sensor histidine kinase [Segetibacter sp. 3557_3]|uniref:GAF domain-containing sensor histidine kinase n=1 Tax=Segetibacter sp. 3557_3 TaxID=2547429 RepID=UPI001058E635|nr:ATP-binding protein [Segetibacter sp. 3557_3]TDH29258.1 GAF domain-containing sensor histidine kinase [Segetibacter sp. 3557_3]
MEHAIGVTTIDIRHYNMILLRVDIVCMVLYIAAKFQVIMDLDQSATNLPPDVLLMQKVSITATILDVVCRTTGMGFAAIAKVTEDRWITCSVLDRINFGLRPGDELKVESTICHEIRQSCQAVVIEQVDDDNVYARHHTPKLYGFQSYISVPVFKRNGSFFGTLCAIDPKPARINTPEILGMFNLFADLISFHLDAAEQLEESQSALTRERQERTDVLEEKNAELEKMNLELESFAHVASHDLQEPLRKIETFSNFILERDYDNLSGSGKQYFDRLIRSVKRMQTLIKDLIMYTQVKVHDKVFEKIALGNIVEEVTQNFAEELHSKQGKIEASKLCLASVIPFQFNQLLQNIIGNSIKFSRPDVSPVITITSCIEVGNTTLSERLSNDKQYCHITICDNGIGFDPKHSQKIFEVFQRLNGRHEYDGTGIGLSIVKKIVDNHNGFITASSEPDHGARFDIYIPQH